MTLEEQVVTRLIESAYHIACAESCTGGLLCGRIVNVPNASRVLDCSFTTYANEAKIKYLGVSPITISEFGVVSEEVASEMASGVATQADCEVGVGVTGIAGPSGGTEKKPVGMVCFGFSICGKVTTFTQYFTGMARNEVRAASVDFAMSTLLQLLTVPSESSLHPM